MRAATRFEVQKNSFTGALPLSGIRAMMAVTVFAICFNRLTGTIPGHPFATAGSDLLINNNCFAGTVPAAFKGLSLVLTLDLSQNYFEGSIPAWLQAQAILISHTLLAGSIPQQALAGSSPVQKWVVADASVLPSMRA
eukprot:5651992-Amphidinium_carterae.1